MICSRCGTQFDDGVKICPECGLMQNSQVDLEKTVGILSPAFAQQTVGQQGYVQSTPVQQPVQPAPVQQPVQPTPVQQPVQPTPVQQPIQPAPVQQPVQPTPVQQPVHPTPVPNSMQQRTPVAPVSNPQAALPHNGYVGFGKAIALFFKNYVNFRGRASKSEFWFSFLFCMLITTVMGTISSPIPPVAVFCVLVSFGLMLPEISVMVRRLHDTGTSGKYAFMGFIPFAGAIILYIRCGKDSVGDNQWGRGPVLGNTSTAFVPTKTVASSYTAIPTPPKATDADIFQMAQRREPVNVYTPEAKIVMDSALSRVIPTYSGRENLANALMLCDPQSIKATITATDTDTLFVLFKALRYYMEQGVDANVLGVVQQNVVATLKQRFNCNR
ncbi:MAG: DUF805 domain-containing protein [Clostridia bacterium]|nr:DUF805 domain-containing protein [Clostridia bacterium]